MATCSVAGCRRQCQRREPLCFAHAQRKVRLGSPTARKCRRCKQVFDDEHMETARVRAGSWLCDACFALRQARLDAVVKRPRMKGKTCKVIGCGRPVHSKNVCCTHYARLRTAGSPVKVKCAKCFKAFTQPEIGSESRSCPRCEGE